MIYINLDTKRLSLNTISADDFPAVLAIYNDSFYKEAAGIYKNISKDDLIDLLYRIKDNDFFLIAKEKREKKFVGLIKGFLDIDKKIIWLSILAIEKEFLRKGYGSEIVTACTNYIKFYYNVVKILLTVKETNLEAQSFWLSLHFTLLLTIQSAADISYLYGKSL